MAIVKMNKFTLLTFESNKDELLRKLQSFAEVEFINLQKEEIIEKYNQLSSFKENTLDSEFEQCKDNLSKTKSALEFLQKYTQKKSMLQELRTEKQLLTVQELENEVKDSNWESIIDSVKGKEIELHSLEAKITKLKTDIELLSPWINLDVTFEELKELKQVSYFLGTVSKQYEEQLVESIKDGYLEIISRTTNDINFLVIVNKNRKEEVTEILRGYGFSSFKTEYKDSCMKLTLEFKHEIEDLNSKIFFVKEEIKGLEEENASKLKMVFDYFSDELIRKNSVKNFRSTKSVLAMQGWIPVERNEELNSICNELLGKDYHIEYAEVEKEEVMEVPIQLKNGELISSFESVTSMFAYPKYDEVDPTPLLTPFYLIFFGMMVADIGYGILMMLTALGALKFFYLEKTQKQMAKFFFWLSIPTIAFGIIYGSLFGGIIDLPKIIDTELQVNEIMIISIIFGVIQIFTGLTIKAWMLVKTGRALDAFLDVGSWVIALVSIAIFGFAGLNDLSQSVEIIGIIGMVIGGLLIVYAGGREEKSHGAKIGQGLYSLYGITNYVSDLVSYTRLMALGLAGGSIAAAINMIIETLPGWSAIIVAPLIFVLAHIFNLGLGLLGAYVHTARLQYIEYFGKFYEGGGREFKAFKTTEKYINIKK
ncbi:MAG: V-type ATP synthase subunit I [Clostridium sp.]